MKSMLFCLIVLLGYGCDLYAEVNSQRGSFGGGFPTTAIVFSLMTVALLLLGIGLLRARKNEQALIRSEEKFRTLFNCSDDSIILLDRAGRLLDCNPAALKLFAVPDMETFCRLSLAEISSEETAGINLSKLLNEGRDVVDCILKETSGREFPATIDLSEIDFLGRSVLMGTVRDKTVQKRGELFSETNRCLERSVLLARDGIWEWDMITGKIFFDDRYSALIGYDSGEILTDFEEWVKRIHPDDKRTVEKAFKRYLNGETLFYEVEFRFLKKDETWMLMMARGKVVAHDDDGKPTRFIGIHSDISELKRTEKALSRARKMDAVSQLAGGVAHDFNNLIGIVAGNLDLLKLQTGSDEKYLKRIQAAQNAVIRVNDLTKQLLSFSRRHAGNASIVGLNRLIHEAENLISRSAGTEVEVEYTLGDNLWLTEIDPGEFEDAVFNMVLNAKDVMSSGGLLSIETGNHEVSEADSSATPVLRPGQYVRLSVSDSGAGIPEEHLDRIFEPFFTTKARGKGIGLGLSMVFGFVKRYGGHIKVESEPGIGTSFHIYLPRATGSEETSEPTYDVSADLPRGSETILLVDDEADLLELARITLESQGYRVLTASNGQQALVTLAENPFTSLMFSDVVMPGGINGYELSEEAAKLYPKLKIVLTSGYTDEKIPASFNLLKKPYKQPELLHLIRETLDENTKTSTRAPKKASLAIQWSETFDIGVDILDADHRVLLEQLNRGRKILDSGEEEELHGILNKLLHYSKVHFKREELIMDVCGFPQLQNHRQVHQLLTMEVKEKIVTLEKGELGARELTEFIGRWLMNHIQIMDSAITPYCRKKKELIDQALLEAGLEEEL